MSEPFSTPVQNLRRWSALYANKEFLIQPVIGQPHRTYSYAQTWNLVQRIAQGILNQGVSPGQRVGLLSKNCAEWFIVDWAMQLAGVISVPFYPTQSLKALTSTLENFPVDLLIIGKLDSPENYQALTSLGLKTASLPYDHFETDVSWQSLIDEAPLPGDKHFDAQPNDVMTIHFTSGTNGPAKGVELTYQAYHYACQNTQQSMNVSAEDRFLSYLPLAHIAERMMIQGNAVFSGAPTYFVSSLDNFVTDLKYAKPTAFMSVPRLWKNFQTGIHSKIPPRVLDTLLSTPGISWVMKKLVRKLLGLSSARLTGSGAAAMPVELLKWYERIGIPISEAWGLTETCGLSTMNYPYDPKKAGTIGNAVPGTDIKLAADGELLIKSKGLFQHYADNAEATDVAFDQDGYFRTGDLAQWNEQTSAWQLLGRKNDTFKTSKGKFVNPAHIETQLNQNDLIEQSCVVGEGRKQPLALVQLASNEGENKSTADKLTQVLQTLNSQLEKHEQLEAIYVSQNAWTPENNMVTPTLKIRRRRIAENYQALLPETTGSEIGWLEKI